MIHLDAQQTRDCLDYIEVANQIETVLDLQCQGLATAPERLIMPWNEQDSLLLMPAYDTDYLITKMVTVCRGNAAKQLPTVQGNVIVLRKSDGTRMLELDGATVTAFRTAALSRVAMRRMGYQRIENVTVFGTGVQARAHIEAIHQQHPDCQFFVQGRHPNRIDEFVDSFAPLGLSIGKVNQLHEAIRRSDLIVTATNSSCPVLSLEPFSLGTSSSKLIVAVGAYRPEMAELSAELVREVRVPIIVDTVEGALLEAGDLIQAGTTRSELLGLAFVQPVVDRPAGLSLFKSVGNALWDLAACRAAINKLWKSTTSASVETR